MGKAIDPRIEMLRSATDDDRERQIAELIVTVARPLAQRVLQRSTSSGGAVTPQDAEDILATICLRLIVKLRRLVTADEDEIECFDDYVAMLAYNAVNDHLRRAHPRRTRLKNRIRYALDSDSRLALWTTNDRLAGGLAAWRGASPGGVPLIPRDLARQIPDYDHPAEALAMLFAFLGRPVFVDALVDVLAGIWDITDAPPPAMVEKVDPGSRVLESLESRELLEALWREIVQLRPMQREALLLNLRDPGTPHVLSLFVTTGVATMDAIARALRMTARELAAIWNELPLDDLRIAEMLNVSRQQVITLRRSARERLTRRLSSRKGTT